MKNSTFFVYLIFAKRIVINVLNSLCLTLSAKIYCLYRVLQTVSCFAILICLDRGRGVGSLEVEVLSPFGLKCVPYAV